MGLVMCRITCEYDVSVCVAVAVAVAVCGGVREGEGTGACDVGCALLMTHCVHRHQHTYAAHPWSLALWLDLGLRR